MLFWLSLLLLLYGVLSDWLLFEERFLEFGVV